jgi:hypothetical protein
MLKSYLDIIAYVQRAIEEAGGVPVSEQLGAAEGAVQVQQRDQPHDDPDDRLDHCGQNDAENAQHPEHDDDREHE